MANFPAFHWIATTFGSWLHGDPRGSWHQGRLIDNDPFLVESVRQRMHRDTVVLSTDEITRVSNVFGDLLREKDWKVWAATIQPTHAHLVFARLNGNARDVIAVMKYRSARQVLAERRAQGREAGRSLWTEGQFYVLIEDEEQLFNTIEYVRNHNIRVGLPADPYAWITTYTT